MKTLDKPPTSTFTPEPSTVKRWTVEDYHRMGELGILQPDERTELIEGQVLFMAAKGTPHTVALRLLSRALDTALANLPFHVITQDPILLNDFSEPEPDCLIASGTILDYISCHPNPSDIALIVEVADSTLKYDTQVKDKIYAQSGVTDYWVLDVKNRQLHVFRNPTAQGYSSHLILAEPNQISPLAFPGISVTLTGILPP
jgi:Uma2 family endonuclease